MATHIYSDHNYYDHRGLKVKSPEYKTWSNVRSKYKDQFCDEWNSSFMNFINDMGLKPVGEVGKRNTITLKRYDESLPYCKENCYWSAPKRPPRAKKEPKPKQPKEKKIVGKQITFNGMTMNMSEWEHHL